MAWINLGQYSVPVLRMDFLYGFAEKLFSFSNCDGVFFCQFSGKCVRDSRGQGIYDVGCAYFQAFAAIPRIFERGISVGNVGMLTVAGNVACNGPFQLHVPFGWAIDELFDLFLAPVFNQFFENIF